MPRVDGVDADIKTEASILISCAEVFRDVRGDVFSRRSASAAHVSLRCVRKTRETIQDDAGGDARTVRDAGNARARLIVRTT